MISKTKKRIRLICEQFNQERNLWNRKVESGKNNEQMRNWNRWWPAVMSVNLHWYLPPVKHNIVASWNQQESYKKSLLPKTRASFNQLHGQLRILNKLYSNWNDDYKFPRAIKDTMIKSFWLLETKSSGNRFSFYCGNALCSII